MQFRWATQLPDYFRVELNTDNNDNNNYNGDWRRRRLEEEEMVSDGFLKVNSQREMRTLIREPDHVCSRDKRDLGGEWAVGGEFHYY